MSFESEYKSLLDELAANALKRSEFVQRVPVSITSHGSISRYVDETQSRDIKLGGRYARDMRLRTDEVFSLFPESTGSSHERYSLVLAQGILRQSGSMDFFYAPLKNLPSVTLFSGFEKTVREMYPHLDVIEGVFKSDIRVVGYETRPIDFAADKPVAIRDRYGIHLLPDYHALFVGTPNLDDMLAHFPASYHHDVQKLHCSLIENGGH